MKPGTFAFGAMTLFAALGITIQTSAQGPIFAPAVPYGSGGESAYSIAVADVNGDGKPDLVVANSDSNTVGVLLGNGDGTFRPAVAYGSGGPHPESIVVADVNGDGKPDLVVANSFSNTVGVLLGNGDGTFQPVITYISGGNPGNPLAVAVADVNGDGKPDLLVGNWANSVGVLLGNGDGTFQPVVTYDSGGQQPNSIAVADVNGDGKPDLLVANLCDASGNCAPGVSNIGVLLGNGDGTFQPVVTYSSGGSAWSIAVSDVNGDGKPDLVVANSLQARAGVVGVLLGNGDGTFQSVVTYDSAGSINSLAVGDVNGDGKPDLVVANVLPGAAGVLLGNGDGTFQQVMNYASGGYRALSVAVADVNGDGKPDLLVANSCASASNCANGVAGVLLMLSRASSATTIVSSSNPSVFGQAVTFTATVTSQGSGIPTGTVTFSDGSTTLGTSPLSGAIATLSTAALTVGPHTINAVYSGDSNFSGSSGSLGQTVNEASTTLALGSSVNPSVSGQPVTFPVIITPQYGGQATGTVTFKDGATTLGSPTVSGNAASLTTSNLAIGTHSITAVYSGDTNFVANSSSLTQKVNKAATKTLFSSSLNPSLIGQSVTFTATVNPAFGGTPTGTITFNQLGTGVLATETLSGGAASFTTSFSAAGTYKIFATYKGDANFLSSVSASITQKVNEFPTSTVVTSNLNPSNFGQSVTFTATVSSSYGTPTGTITFRRGTTALESIGLTGNTATFSTSALNAGTNSINAVYSGDTNFATSTSPNLSQKVNKIASTTTLASSVNPSSLGQSVTFTATVTAASGAPTGTITFKNGSTTLGTATLSGGMATFATSKLPSGSNSIKASYGGSINYLTSSSTVLVQVVH